MFTRAQASNDELKKTIEDLESRNRTLVDKLNSSIYNRATEYKEKTLQALMGQSRYNASNTISPSRKSRETEPPSHARLEEMINDDRRR